MDKNNHLDIVLVNPGDGKQVYQGLGQDHSAVEPPFWAAVIAAYLRNNGFNAAIIDANAENLSPQEVASRIADLKPALAAVIVCGSQPSASTQNMTIAGKISRCIKDSAGVPVVISGLHPSALPRQTLEEGNSHFVVEGPGGRSFKDLIEAIKGGRRDYRDVPGLWYYDGGDIRNNPRAPLLDNLDEELPVAAWDLLPMDKYKAHNWHCFDDLENRKPYAAIYTSLGCPFNCLFCCINSLFGKPGIRYRKAETVVNEIGLLVDKYGIKNIKIIDELFVLNEAHYMKIVELLLQKNYGLNIWAYARVDTIKLGNLAKMKKAGINWLALGIESANPLVRDGMAKNMNVKDIKLVVRSVQDAGIRVIGNFIFGLPDDTLETMKETFDMAKELNCEFANFYYGMAYPGSRLYDIAIDRGWRLPGEWSGFSQYSYEAVPLPTKHVSAREVLSFRDDAFNTYYNDPRYLDMVGEKFGVNVKNHIQEMTRHKLRRRLLE